MLFILTTTTTTTAAVVIFFNDTEKLRIINSKSLIKSHYTFSLTLKQSRFQSSIPPIFQFNLNCFKFTYWKKIKSHIREFTHDSRVSEWKREEKKSSIHIFHCEKKKKKIEKFVKLFWSTINAGLKINWKNNRHSPTYYPLIQFFFSWSFLSLSFSLFYTFFKMIKWWEL